MLSIFLHDIFCHLKFENYIFKYSYIKTLSVCGIRFPVSHLDGKLRLRQPIRKGC